MLELHSSIINILILGEKLFILLNLILYTSSLGAVIKIKQLSIIRKVAILLAIRDIAFELVNLPTIKEFAANIDFGLILFLISNISVIYLYSLGKFISQTEECSLHRYRHKYSVTIFSSIARLLL